MEFAPAFRAAGRLGVDDAALKAGVVGRNVMRHAVRRVGSRLEAKIVSEVREADPLTSESVEQALRGAQVSQRTARTHNSRKHDARWHQEES